MTTKTRAQLRRQTARQIMLIARTPGRLRARCWCCRHDVMVPTETIRAGRTETCGRSDCYEGRRR